jgi:hypothetical protein
MFSAVKLARMGLAARRRVDGHRRDADATALGGVRFC